MASHLGGTRNPMVIAWPSRIKHDTKLRSQFTHCIDVAPTILEAAGIPEPKVVDGIGQEPMDGTSYLYTFDDARPRRGQSPARSSASTSGSAMTTSRRSWLRAPAAGDPCPRHPAVAAVWAR